MKISPARRAALTLLYRDRWLSQPDWDTLVEELIVREKIADVRDRRLFTHLAAGSVRLLGRLDARLLRLTGREDLDDAVRAALRLALYQLEELDRLPAHAVVGEAVEWVKKLRGQRLAGWTNAQLRRFLREGIPGSGPDPADDPTAYGVEELSYPRWLVRRWLAELGDEKAFAVMEAMNGREGVSFRWNLRRPGREALLERLAENGARPRLSADLPEAFRMEGAVPEAVWEALADGRLSVQDQAAQRAALLLAGGGGASWTDVCAAPGGKTGHLAELAPAGTKILALDRSAARMEKVVANLGRLGFSGVETRIGDLLETPVRPADGILLDAPCSALGVLAENPDARWRKGEDQIAPLAARQAELLARASDWVLPGGTLVYSVCTLTPEETVQRRDAFLEQRPEFRLDPIRPGEAGFEMAGPEGDLMIWPGREHGAGGYTVRFRRTE